MAGEIQLNSTTMATESSGSITLSNVNSATNRTNLGLGSIATQAADSVSISGGNITGGTIGSSVVFPAGHVINYKFVEIGKSELSGTYTGFNGATAAESTEGLQVVTTSFTPNSNNSKIFCQAQLFVQEDSNSDDLAMAALFVDTTNISQQFNNDRSDGAYLDYVVATLAGEYTNSSTTAKTIQIRVSGSSSSSIDVNVGNKGGNKDTAAYIRTGLSIFEVQQ